MELVHVGGAEEAAEHGHALCARGVGDGRLQVELHRGAGREDRRRVGGERDGHRAQAFADRDDRAFAEMEAGEHGAEKTGLVAVAAGVGDALEQRRHTRVGRAVLDDAPPDRDGGPRLGAAGAEERGEVVHERVVAGAREDAFEGLLGGLAVHRGGVGEEEEAGRGPAGVARHHLVEQGARREGRRRAQRRRERGGAGERGREDRLDAVAQLELGDAGRALGGEHAGAGLLEEGDGARDVEGEERGGALEVLREDRVRDAAQERDAGARGGGPHAVQHVELGPLHARRGVGRVEREGAGEEVLGAGEVGEQQAGLGAPGKRGLVVGETAERLLGVGLAAFEVAAQHAQEAAHAEGLGDLADGGVHVGDRAVEVAAGDGGDGPQHARARVLGVVLERAVEQRGRVVHVVVGEEHERAVELHLGALRERVTPRERDRRGERDGDVAAAARVEGGARSADVRTSRARTRTRASAPPDSAIDVPATGTGPTPSYAAATSTRRGVRAARRSRSGCATRSRRRSANSLAASNRPASARNTGRRSASAS